MTTTPLEKLLQRCEHDGGSEADRAELARALDEQAAAIEGLVVALRSGLSDAVGSVDVVSDVMAQLLADEHAVDEALQSLSDGLRQEASGFDIADAVCASIEDPEAELSALADGELSVAARRRLAKRLGADPAARLLVSDFVETGRVLRAAIQDEVALSGFEGVWNEVAEAIGLQDAQAVPGWEPVATLLREALADEVGPIDVADAVMDDLGLWPRERRVDAAVAVVERAPVAVDRGRSFLPAALAVGLAAALVLIWTSGPIEPGLEENASLALALGEPADTGVHAFEGDAYAFAEENDTEIEELEIADDAMVQVFSLGEGAPTVIFLDEHAFEDEHAEPETSEGATL